MSLIKDIACIPAVNLTGARRRRRRRRSYEGSGFNFFGSGFGGGLEGIIEHLVEAEDFNERLQGDEEDLGRNSETDNGCLI